MTSEDTKASLATLFAERVPSSQGDADVSLEVDSFTMFAPLEGGDLLARLALTSDETLDLAINPVCALRLAATILDQLHKSGDYVVELSNCRFTIAQAGTKLRAFARESSPS